jgi:3-oxoacyl-[acyl-carrier-protein] synthase II
MNKKRVVVTGVGITSCFGHDPNAFFSSLLLGKSGVKPITRFDCSEYEVKIAATIDDFNAEEWMDKKTARRVDPVIAYAYAAAMSACQNAGLSREEIKNLNKHRMGAIIGSGMGGLTTAVCGTLTLHEKGHRRLSPFFIPHVITNMGTALVGIDLGLMGPNYSISTACATGNHCIISAAKHIQYGDADLMLCGGAEMSTIPLGLTGFIACRALSKRNEEPQKASRPWDKDRDGFVMGEGAGVLVLESLEHAQARGATILAEYLGGSVNCDAHHITEPRPDGAGVKMCVEGALINAGLSPDSVDYINAHGTSTPAGDMAEVRALQQVFKHPETIYMNSTKSMIGHALGGAGGLEAVVTVLSLNKGKIHPNINLDNPEEGIGFTVPTQEIEAPIQIGLNNSFGFGGHNSCVVFGAYKG